MQHGTRIWVPPVGSSTRQDSPHAPISWGHDRRTPRRIRRRHEGCATRRSNDIGQIVPTPPAAQRGPGARSTSTTPPPTPRTRPRSTRSPSDGEHAAAAGTRQRATSRSRRTAPRHHGRWTRDPWPTCGSTAIRIVMLPRHDLSAWRSSASCRSKWSAWAAIGHQVRADKEARPSTGPTWSWSAPQTHEGRRSSGSPRTGHAAATKIPGAGPEDQATPVDTARHPKVEESMACCKPRLRAHGRPARSAGISVRPARTSGGDWAVTLPVRSVDGGFDLDRLDQPAGPDRGHQHTQIHTHGYPQREPTIRPDATQRHPNTGTIRTGVQPGDQRNCPVTWGGASGAWGQPTVPGSGSGRTDAARPLGSWS